MEDSPFLDESRWVNQNNLAFAWRDQHPISPGHTLVLPKRVIASLWEMTPEEMAACWDLIWEESFDISEKHSPDGFNIGINVGKDAGQTVAHVHIHIIPRYKGDHPDPTGGVIAVIPGKANYLK
jgi:diadenosine tetraphosphate (Ap4A) HIT family hydrolase